MIFSLCRRTEVSRIVSTYVLANLTLLLLVLLNPAASRDVRPAPGVPALASRASASLSFVFLTLPAAPAHSRSQSGSNEHTGAPFQSGGARSLLKVPSVFSQVRVHESGRSGAGGYCFLAPKRGGSLPFPFIYRYLCVVSCLPASYLTTQCWRCSFVQIQMYLPGFMLIPWIFRMVWYLSNSTQRTC